MKKRLESGLGHVRRFVSKHKKTLLAAALILFLTLLFFSPYIKNIATYSDGGDSMFNSWTLGRDKHCILRQGCPSYSDGNIYFPNKDTMLYSETQLSTGLLSLPLFSINDSPLFVNNVWTILSFFFAGFFMYLLAKYLNKGNELFAILAGLVFEFAPFKMASVGHLQNLSIFFLPLAVLLLLKYIEKPARKYLAWFFVVLVLQFYASWYQMVFVLMCLGALLLGILVLRVAKLKTVITLGLVITLAVATTLPLAQAYTQFSKTNQASFTIQDQIIYSASVADYVKPHDGTLLGKLYYNMRPGARVNSFNPDSYSYHGLVVYAVAFLLAIIAYKKLRKDKAKKDTQSRLILIFLFVALVGFVISLGPLLKIRESSTYSWSTSGVQLSFPMPYLFIDMLLPQLSFIRAIGRASVINLFALSCLLAYTPLLFGQLKMRKRSILVATIGIVGILCIEVFPAHLVKTNPSPTNSSFTVPAVYDFVKSRPEIDKIAIIRADKDYPGAAIPTAPAEDVLWAGYHNKNIFNGYSGYTPPAYNGQLADFTDFQQDDVAKLKKLNIQYVLVDKKLSTSNPKLNTTIGDILQTKVYEDTRYSLYKL